MTSSVAEYPPLIRAMLCRDFYPHDVHGDIELIQTHISYILLTGEFAYKVKKPVNLGFVDFSTLPLRRHFCQEELRLNRRGARGLYLEVLPINSEDGDFQLNGPGETVEYALKMRQFPSGSLMSERLEKGQVSEERVVELARFIAKYHADAASSPGISRLGQPEKIRHAIDDNYHHTERFIGGPLTGEQFKLIREFTDRFFKSYDSVLRERVTGGSIRECHGDLHLANICIWNERILLFDCIEFNEQFRYVDVIYDLAFAAMDMEARGRRDLATRIVNEYAERTGDWEGLRVLPLYLCRQAYVRAKVNSLLLEDADVSEEKKQAAAKTAGLYYRLAAHYAEPRQGKLVLMSGLSGSGKSTVAREIARRSGAVHIRSDAVRKHLAGVPLDEKAAPEIYGEPMTQRTYDRLLELGITLAGDGFTVILDARYDRQSIRLKAIGDALAAGLDVQIVHCEAPDSVLRDRLNARQRDVSDATGKLLDQQRARAEPFTDAERQYVKSLDTSQPLDLLGRNAIV